MKTKDKPSELINKAITNLPKDSGELALKLWECMKEATVLELKALLQLESKKNPARKMNRRQIYLLEA